VIGGVWERLGRESTEVVVEFRSIQVGSVLDRKNKSSSTTTSAVAGAVGGMSAALAASQLNESLFFPTTTESMQTPCIRAI
jgi:hypothetical protein